MVIEFFDTVLSVEVYFGVVYLLVSVFVFVFVFVIVFVVVIVSVNRISRKIQ